MFSGGLTSIAFADTVEDLERLRLGMLEAKNNASAHAVNAETLFRNGDTVAAHNEARQSEDWTDIAQQIALDASECYDSIDPDVREENNLDEVLLEIISNYEKSQRISDDILQVTGLNPEPNPVDEDEEMIEIIILPIIGGIGIIIIIIVVVIRIRR